MEFTSRGNSEICQDLLTLLALKIQAANGLNLTDVNVFAEEFFKGLLNLIYKWDLENLNIADQNSQSLDLGCSVSQIAIQVTSTTKAPKIRKTIKGFKKNKLEKDYTRLIFVFPVMKKPAFRADFSKDLPGGFDFDLSRDSLCFTDLLREITGFEIPEQERIIKFLEEQLKPLRGILGPVLGKDLTVDRIFDLILYLSDPNPSVPITEDDDPAPGEKLDLLAKYACYLLDQWGYGDGHICIAEAKKAVGYDGVRARRTACHLKAISSEALRKNNGDAQAAFEDIVHNLSTKVGAIGQNFESSAIRYFLASEFQQCNVFPLKTIKECIA